MFGIGVAQIAAPIKHRVVCVVAIGSVVFLVLCSFIGNPPLQTLSSDVERNARLFGRRACGLKYEDNLIAGCASANPVAEIGSNYEIDQSVNFWKIVRARESLPAERKQVGNITRIHA